MHSLLQDSPHPPYIRVKNYVTTLAFPHWNFKIPPPHFYFFFTFLTQNFKLNWFAQIDH